MLLSAEKPCLFIENDRGGSFVTKQVHFTAITRIMKTLANSHHKFHYVAYCFCHSRQFNLTEKVVVSMFIDKLKRILLFFLSTATNTFLVIVVIFFFFSPLVVVVVASVVVAVLVVLLVL